MNEFDSHKTLNDKSNQSKELVNGEIDTMISTMQTQILQQPTRRHTTVPNEIVIKLSPRSGEDQAVEEQRSPKTVTQHRSSAPSYIHMDWNRPQHILSGSRQITPDDMNGCIVSLSSFDINNTSMSTSMSIDPLDYRKDWSNDLTMCISQHPQLFEVEEMRVIPDDNSLCSNLSEEYEMEADDDMAGLWDSEHHDILIPAWVSDEKEI